MGIDKHMTFKYDLKVDDPSTKPHFLDASVDPNDPNSIVGRMFPAEKKIFLQFYDSVHNDLKLQNLKGKELAIWKYQRYVKDYLKSAKALDDNIGRLMNYLKENDLLDNTLIIYTSDQGFYMGEHGWFDKRFMYEESLRTPLVMRLPESLKKMRGKTIPQMVQNIDHAATFLNIAGIKVPSDIQGESYYPLLKGENPKSWRKAIYYHYQEYPAEHTVKRHYGIRTEKYKLMHFYNDIDTWELYDILNDPNEMNNLIDNKDFDAIEEELRNELFELQVKYNDPIRLKYPL
jgi:arylsulfatase A-like enzyme